MVRTCGTQLLQIFSTLLLAPTLAHSFSKATFCRFAVTTEISTHPTTTDFPMPLCKSEKDCRRNYPKVLYSWMKQQLASMGFEFTSKYLITVNSGRTLHLWQGHSRASLCKRQHRRARSVRTVRNRRQNPCAIVPSDLRVLVQWRKWTFQCNSLAQQDRNKLLLQSYLGPWKQLPRWHQELWRIGRRLRWLYVLSMRWRQDLLIGFRLRGRNLPQWSLRYARSRWHTVCGTNIRRHIDSAFFSKCYICNSVLVAWIKIEFLCNNSW